MTIQYFGDILKYYIQFLPEGFAFLLLILNRIEARALPVSIRATLTEGLRSDYKNSDKGENLFKDINRAINVENLRNMHFVPGLIALISATVYGIVGYHTIIALTFVLIIVFVFAVDIKFVITNLNQDNYPIISRRHFWITTIVLGCLTFSKIISLSPKFGIT